MKYLEERASKVKRLKGGSIQVKYGIIYTNGLCRNYGYLKLLQNDNLSSEKNSNDALALEIDDEIVLTDYACGSYTEIEEC